MPAGITDYTTPGLFDSHAGGSPFGFAQVGNLVYTTLAADLTAGATTIEVVSTADFQSRGVVVLGREAIFHAGKTATQFTLCTRAADGTTAEAHTAGATVRTYPVAANHNDLAAAIVAIQAAVPRKFADTTLGAAAGTIDFNNIPQTYAGLVLHLYCRNDTAPSNIMARLSSDGTTYDAGANYDWQFLLGNAAVASAGEFFAQSYILVGGMGAAANVFNLATLTIPHYANATNQKVALGQTARKDGTTTGLLNAYFTGGFWRNTAAIKGIRLLPAANNFAIGTRAVLYGMP